jgi:gentisate 1,2-dioxygenase
MVPGDLVITPSWSWHDHANESDVPILWLDSLDAPLVRLLEVGFREDYPDEIQPPGEGNDNSQARYSSGGLRPAWEPAPSTPHTPMCRYPLEQAKAALDRLAAAEAGSPYDGIILEYTNPITGGPVMPTIGCYIQLLRPGEHTECHRHTSCVCYHVVEGSGYTVIDSQRLDWEEKDVFSVPAWAFHEHVNSSDRPAIVFSVTDIPVKRALGYYREQASPSGRQ